MNNKHIISLSDEKAKATGLVEKMTYDYNEQEKDFNKQHNKNDYSKNISIDELD